MPSLLDEREAEDPHPDYGCRASRDGETIGPATIGPTALSRSLLTRGLRLISSPNYSSYDKCCTKQYNYGYHPVQN